MEQQKKELMKLMIEKVDACNDVEKLKLLLKVLESNKSNEEYLELINHLENEKEKEMSILKLSAELLHEYDYHFCDTCGMSDDNPNSDFHCECCSDSEEEVAEPKDEVSQPHSFQLICVNCEDYFNEEDGPELDVEKFGGWVCEHCYDYLVDGVEE
tara:strand:+ start:383 stop:850 length:468 start_codon:yes stop_codon:yes gene_type:complete